MNCFCSQNLGQTPSYVSLATALDYYEITARITDFIKSIAIKRTREIGLSDTLYKYTRIRGNLYFGFEKQKGFFIATPEGLLDAMYLASFGRYALDLCIH